MEFLDVRYNLTSILPIAFQSTGGETFAMFC
jgi:hypothetical protein